MATGAMNLSQDGVITTEYSSGNVVTEIIIRAQRVIVNVFIFCTEELGWFLPSNCPAILVPPHAEASLLI